MCELHFQFFGPEVMNLEIAAQTLPTRNKATQLLLMDDIDILDDKMESLFPYDMCHGRIYEHLPHHMEKKVLFL